MSANHQLSPASGEGPLLRAGRRGPAPGVVWAAGVIVVGVLGALAPRALGTAVPSWGGIVLATALALAVAALRLGLIIRRRRWLLGRREGQG